MPYHVVTRNEKLGVIAFSGTVSGAEIRAAMRSVCESTGWENLHVCWDVRTVRQFVFAPDDLHAILTLSHTLGARMGAGKSALITGPDVDRNVIALLGERLQPSTGRPRIFHSAKEALGWIGMDEGMWSDETIRAPDEVAHPD